MHTTNRRQWILRAKSVVHSPVYTYQICTIVHYQKKRIITSHWNCISEFVVCKLRKKIDKRESFENLRSSILFVVIIVADWICTFLSLIRSVCSDDLLIYRKGLKRLRVSFTLQIGAFYFKSQKCRLFRHFILYQCGNVRGSEECTIRIVLQK